MFPPQPFSTPAAPHSSAHPTARAPAEAFGNAGAWPVNKVRQTFIDFFKAKPSATDGHRFVPSNPVVPHDDPTLLFTNAGMNQFKPLFLAQTKPGDAMHGLKRAVNSQKCIRAGGKHNDLDDVGKDTYHHTFFEMLGNWSFGDYFKAEAIAWSFELLTKVYGVPADRLYATYFKGEPGAGLGPDEESRTLWLKYLPEAHVLPGNMKDNFWEMGETGPCGPCTEIHFDRIGSEGRGGRNAAALVNSGDPDVLEIWNNVFIQFNRVDARTLNPLPARHVDTGMGLERLVSVLQGKRSNYDTDEFLPIFMAIEQQTKGRHSYHGKLGAADKDHVDTAFRVIADHIRTLTFAITDGATPSNEGRGYVLRRILRRAVRYGRQTLGLEAGFFARLTPVVVENFGEFFPELRKNPQRVIDILREEEEGFGKTLDRGMELFQHSLSRSLGNRLVQFNASKVQAAKLVLTWVAKTSPRADGGSLGLEVGIAQEQATGVPAPLIVDSDAHIRIRRGEVLVYDGHGNEINGAVTAKLGLQDLIISARDAFKLHDTYGFPIDLTTQMAEERGLKVDTAGYENLMAEAKDKARAGVGNKFGSTTIAGGHGAGNAAVLQPENLGQLEALGVHRTDDHEKFTGREVRATVKAIWNGGNFDEHIRVGMAKPGAPVAVILDKTGFYAEMGGQEGDHGRLNVTREARSGGSGAAGAGGEFRVDDTRAVGGYTLHIGHITRGELRVGDDVVAHVDTQRRHAVASNHTATHLLNLALRETLGEGVDQKGSLVAGDRLRFDFSHTRPVGPDELAKIERSVGAAIDQGLRVYADSAPLFLAKGVSGLRAVFGEAYPDPVRVVSIGQPVQTLVEKPGADWTRFSVEFCGGTHVASTRDIGHFALTAEEGIAKGVRRISGLTGVPAQAAIAAADGLAARLRAAQGLAGAALAAECAEVGGEIDQMTLPAARKAELRSRLAELQERVKGEQKAASAAKAGEAAAAARRIAAAATADGARFIVGTIDAGDDRKALQAAMNTVVQACPNSAVMLFGPDPAGGTVAVMAVVPPILVGKGLSAGDWVREAATLLDGKGGGRPEAAQGGGTNVERLGESIAAATAFARKKIGV